MVRFKVDTPVIRFSIIDSPIKFEVNEAIKVYADSIIYDGPCHVIPKTDCSQILPTTGRVLKEDIVVQPIPYYETDNQKGTTVFIGSEV